MPDFEQRLKLVPIDKIKSYLESLKKPCYESQLLKIAFIDFDIINDDSLKLYQNHFMLFHILYKLQEHYYNNNKYLHVHFMRTFLLEYPEKNHCRFYNDTLYKFCSEECLNDDDYCNFHLNKIGKNHVDFSSSKYFYMNIDNYYKLDKKTAEDLIHGTWEVISNYDNYKKSFDILELPENSSIEIIKKQYKYLAKKYHPDHNKEIGKKFTEINNAYRFLINLLSKSKF